MSQMESFAGTVFAGFLRVGTLSERGIEPVAVPDGEGSPDDNMHPDREMVFDRRLGKLRPINGSLLLSSSKLDWRGYRLEHHYVPSVNSGDIIWMNNMVFLQLSRPATIEVKTEAEFVTHRLEPGQISVVPAQGVTAARSPEAFEMLSLSLAPTFMATACSGLADPDQIELPARHGVDDPYIGGVCLALKKEVEEGGRSGRLYSDSLATGLAVHLATKYGIANRPNRLPRAGLSPRIVRQATEFILSRLREDVTLNEIAGAVGLSPFHFARSFRQAVGVSPYQWLLRQRIELAKQLLIRGGMSLAAVASEVGFYDQSHFARHFKKITGLTPGEFAAKFHNRVRTSR